MATKAHLHCDRATEPAATVVAGAYLNTVAGVTGTKVYKNIDMQSVQPVLRSYIALINAKGGAPIPVLSKIDQQSFSNVIKKITTSLNILKP